MRMRDMQSLVPSHPHCVEVGFLLVSPPPPPPCPPIVEWRVCSIGALVPSHPQFVWRSAVFSLLLLLSLLIILSVG